jgi:hypothetical protein
LHTWGSPCVPMAGWSLYHFRKAAGGLGSGTSNSAQPQDSCLLPCLGLGSGCSPCHPAEGEPQAVCLRTAALSSHLSSQQPADGLGANSTAICSLEETGSWEGVISDQSTEIGFGEPELAGEGGGPSVSKPAPFHLQD